jgi:hypothetical protein
MDRAKKCKSFRRQHCLATTPAAVADETYPLPDILAELRQMMVVSLLQQVKALGSVNRTRNTVTGQGSCDRIKGHAYVHRRVACPAHVHHLMTAKTDTNTNGGCVADYFACAIMVQNSDSGSRLKSLFMGKYPSELGFAMGKQFADEVFLNAEVLIEQFSQYLLIDIASNPHHGKFEKSGHWGRQHISHMTILILHIQQEAPRSEEIKLGMRLRLGNFPDARCGFDFKWFDGKQCNAPGLRL